MNKHLKQYYYIKGYLFPSYAEKQFRKVMGWRYHLYGFRFQTKVRGYVIDFTTTRYGKKIAIEIDGAKYHGRQDIVRDWRLKEDGWHILRIPAKALSDKKRIRREVRRFIFQWGCNHTTFKLKRLSRTMLCLWLNTKEPGFPPPAMKSCDLGTKLSWLFGRWLSGHIHYTPTNHPTIKVVCWLNRICLPDS